MTRDRDVLEALVARYAGDGAALLADAELGRRIRAKNRAAARQRRVRQDDTDHALLEAVARLRARDPHRSLTQIAQHLVASFGNETAIDPREALRRRIERLTKKAGRTTSLVSGACGTIPP